MPLTAGRLLLHGDWRWVPWKLHQVRPGDENWRNSSKSSRDYQEPHVLTPTPYKQVTEYPLPVPCPTSKDQEVCFFMKLNHNSCRFSPTSTAECKRTRAYLCRTLEDSSLKKLNRLKKPQKMIVGDPPRRTPILT